MAQEEDRTHDEGADEIDPIWTSSRTARQIYALGEVEKDITRLLALAGSCVALLTLPQTDAPDSTLPPGEERSEQFVLEASEYFERLDAIQVSIRSSLAHIRQSRIAPSAITAPPPGFVPPSLGVSIPPDPRVAAPGDGVPQAAVTGTGMASTRARDMSTTMSAGMGIGKDGLQETRADRDAWVGILGALNRLAAAREREKQQKEKAPKKGKQGEKDDDKDGGEEAMDVSA